MTLRRVTGVCATSLDNSRSWREVPAYPAKRLCDGIEGHANQPGPNRMYRFVDVDGGPRRRSSETPVIPGVTGLSRWWQSRLSGSAR